MTFSEVITQDQVERQLTDNGFFQIGEASPVETSNLLRAIELNIQARRENLANMAMWQRVGDRDAKAGYTLAAARSIQNSARCSALIKEIEAELAHLFARAAQAFGNKALKSSG